MCDCLRGMQVNAAALLFRLQNRWYFEKMGLSPEERRIVVQHYIEVGGGEWVWVWVWVCAHASVCI